MQRQYTAGERCDKCGTPTIMGSKGAYCKPCYIAYKNGQQAPANNNAPAPTQTRPQEDKSVVVGKCKTLFLVEAFKMQMPLAKSEPLAEEWANACIRIIPKTTAQSFGLSGVVHTPTATHNPVMEVPTIQQEEVNISEIPF